VGKAGDKLGKDVAPPKTHAFPQPDPKVVPKPRENRRSPGAIGNPKVTTPQPGDGTGGKSPGKANNKPRRNPQGKSAGKPTNVPTAPHGGANEKPKVEQPKPKEEPKPQPQGESKDKS
jgi:hypothetical protein